MLQCLQFTHTIFLSRFTWVPGSPKIKHKNRVYRISTRRHEQFTFTCIRLYIRAYKTKCKHLYASKIPSGMTNNFSNSINNFVTRSRVKSTLLTNNFYVITNLWWNTNYKIIYFIVQKDSISIEKTTFRANKVDYKHTQVCFVLAFKRFHSPHSIRLVLGW